MVRSLRRVLALAALALVPALAGAQSGSITGTVRDSATKAPVTGARVQAVGPTSAATITREDGTYRLANLPAGTYSVSVTRIGYRLLRNPTVAVSGIFDAGGSAEFINNYGPVWSLEEKFARPIGAHSIKAAQVTRRGKTVRVDSVAVIPHAQPGAAIDAAAAHRVRDVLARQGFNGNRVVITAPADKLHVELLELPPRHSGAPVDQLAQVEMMRLSKLEGTAFEMETWDLPAAIAVRGVVPIGRAYRCRREGDDRRGPRGDDRGCEEEITATGTKATRRVS